MIPTRRHVLRGLTLLPVSLAARRTSTADRNEQLVRLEKTSGGRLGVAFVDVGSGIKASYRAGERFPMCSTFKLLAVAAVLARVDRRMEQLDRRIPFGQADLLEYAPVTKARVAEGSMTLADLCDAAITVSDNTAANLILATLGGPRGVTSYATSIGDSVTRLDRIEPQLNEVVPGDPRDTTTPDAMVGNLRRLLISNVLSKASRDRLIGWLIGSKTGAARLRAGLPGNWRAGDKTGSGERGTTNDVAIIWPPGRAPILVAAYLTDTAAAADVRDSTLADVARLIVRAT